MPVAGGDTGLSALSRSINRTPITLGAVVLALILGALRPPFLDYLRPVGDFYVALLHICVLPFLLVTIPLAVRSAMASGSAPGVVRSLSFWVLVMLAGVAAVSVIIPRLIFAYAAPDEGTIARIGALIGRSADKIDVEFAIDARQPAAAAGDDSGILALIPTNIFASLSANDSVRVLVFAALFGVAMVLAERRSGHSIFDALRHIQAVCVLIFGWFNLLVPIGIVALIAPQVALLGPDAFTALKLFAYPFLATAAVLLAAALIVSALALRARPVRIFGALVKPVMLGASTRNSLVCVPLALETLENDLKLPKEPCELYVPIGIATLRVGAIPYFAIATLFVGLLMGREFSVSELGLLAVLAAAASFATIGVSGLAALAPLAIVLRPFGLSYEIAVPLMLIVDPLAEIVRTMLNVGVNCMIPALAASPPAIRAERG
ncbi:MAG TPA: cation:dicarboxylase symporter family transporter [Candidatus Binatia bacterium]|nr:cation:dicarboxylase symporter family transporter [Candidatus Binatia bacterium]